LKAIIVGAGEVGFHIAKRLASENKDVVVIDRNPAVLQRILDHMDVQVLEGSGCSPLVLGEAGIAQADMLLAVTDSDEINLMACTFANMLAPGLTKLARIRNDEYTAYGRSWPRASASASSSTRKSRWCGPSSTCCALREPSISATLRAGASRSWAPG
jgi:Trk K+ transport system NAD-binding subunit